MVDPYEASLNFFYTVFSQKNKFTINKIINFSFFNCYESRQQCQSNKSYFSKGLFFFFKKEKTTQQFKKEKTTQQNTDLSYKKYICLHQEWEPRVGRQTWFLLRAWSSLRCCVRHAYPYQQSSLVDTSGGRSFLHTNKNNNQKGQLSK